MRKIKLYSEYIKESMTTDVDGLLDEINDKKIDFYDLKLSTDDYIDKTIEYLYNDEKFNEQLFKQNLKKGEIQSSDDIENFLRKDIDIKFFFLYNRNDTVLDNPEYLLLQYYKHDKLYSIEIYSIKGNVDNFYNKLTAKEIELAFNNKIYIYYTSNSGNNWELKNLNNVNDKFKSNLETDEIKNLIRNGAELNILN